MTTLSCAPHEGNFKGNFDAAPFLRPIAHRGLHSRASGRIENSSSAFLAAIDRGYGIECDLQAAKDNTPMVFHDARLDRLFPVRGRVSEHSAAELAQLQYRGQATRDRRTGAQDARAKQGGMLSFRALLQLIAGRVPLLVEVKRNRSAPPQGFLERIAAAATAYAGPLALMSFDPEVVIGLGCLAPSVARGWTVGRQQLAKRWWASPSPAGKDRAIGRLLATAPEGIAFLAVEVAILRGARAYLDAEGLTLPLFSWTIRTQRDRRAAARWADAPIFEGCPV